MLTPSTIMAEATRDVVYAPSTVAEATKEAAAVGRVEIKPTKPPAVPREEWEINRGKNVPTV